MIAFLEDNIMWDSIRFWLSKSLAEFIFAVITIGIMLIIIVIIAAIALCVNWLKNKRKKR